MRIIKRFFGVLMFLFIEVHPFVAAPIKTIKIGDKAGEIKIDEQQIGLNFAVDADEHFWLTDIDSKQVKAFGGDGKFLYAVPPADGQSAATIDKIHVIGRYLIILKSDFTLDFYDKAVGTLIAKQKLEIKNAITNKAYFYGSYFFLPQFGMKFPNENIYGFKIDTAEISGCSATSVKSLGLFMDAYKADRKYQFLPVDKDSYPLLKDISSSEFKGQSDDYILIVKNVGNPAKECYYVYVKKERVFKKIGKVSEKITGMIANYGWGSSSIIVDNSLYLLGVKYRNMKDYEQPNEIIISKVDLNSIYKLPDVSNLK